MILLSSEDQKLQELARKKWPELAILNLVLAAGIAEAGQEFIRLAHGLPRLPVCVETLRLTKRERCVQCSWVQVGYS